ncbi:hypothetical protein ACFWM1_26355 [Nocardia sp. NPDC058379]|uniref:hypothetical protein n=1 Tax=unclassified Nocardia TaxID=2637762 RepID=UPI003655E0CB
MSSMEDEHLMSADQQRLVLAVVEAINNGGDVVAQVRSVITPPPEVADIDTVVRIVALDWVGYTMGDKPTVILARLLDRIEEVIDPPS